MSKLPTGGYQPTNRSENLTLPNKGPAYNPNAEKTKTIWHPYPQEKPKECGEYLVTVNCGYFSLTETSTWKDGLFTDYENKPNQMCSIIAWAEMPEPYKEEK